MDSKRETTDAPGRHQGNQESKLQGPATAWKRNDNQWELQEGHRAGNFEASSRNFHWITENEELYHVEGSTPSKTKKRKQPIWEEPIVEAPASLAKMNEGRMNVKRECETMYQRTLDHASARGEHRWRKGWMR
jgi:hypothetical protein